MPHFDEADGEKMRALQTEISRVLRRANDQKLEAAVAAFACIRCARILLDKYPDNVRLQLVDVVSAFLAHQDVEESNLLLLN